MVAQALCRSISQVGACLLRVCSVQLRLVLHGRRLGRRSATSRSPGSKSQQQAFLTFALKASRCVLIRPGRISSFFAMRTALSTLTARWCACSSIGEGSLLFLASQVPPHVVQPSSLYYATRSQERGRPICKPRPFQLFWPHLSAWCDDCLSNIWHLDILRVVLLARRLDHLVDKSSARPVSSAPA